MNNPAKPLFTAHNIRLDNGEYTVSSQAPTISERPWFTASRQLFDTVLDGPAQRMRLADLGCLEGGFSTEFARAGYDVLGMEVRDSNFAACQYVKANVALNNLHFTQDTVLNVERYGRFDGIFCCGLLYHLENPRQYLRTLGALTRKVLILQTHFSLGDEYKPLGLAQTKFRLSDVTQHEGLAGRWFEEFPEQADTQTRDKMRWSSWENHRSFWINKDQLLFALRDAGFDMVFEQFDDLVGPQTVDLGPSYHATLRGTFIGIKR